MRTLLFTLLLIPALSSTPGNDASLPGSTYSADGPLPIGAPMPKGDVRIKDVSGKEITLQQVRQANGLLVMFSCNTCPYVIANQGRTKEVGAYAGNRQIGVVLLNANEGDRSGGNSFAEMQAYAKGQSYPFYYAMDNNSTLADAFGASRTPECYLFDKNGKLVYHGAIDDSPGDPASVKKPHLQNAIDEMVSGKEVSTKETRSVGCSIKRA
ncbi:MAG: thioredoxin family protein [Bacteroidetes bacterium]|nr:thioredoxin family protein [Bacteroidota bacterium]